MKGGGLDFDFSGGNDVCGRFVSGPGWQVDGGCFPARVGQLAAVRRIAADVAGELITAGVVTCRNLDLVSFVLAEHRLKGKEPRQDRGAVSQNSPGRCPNLLIREL